MNLADIQTYAQLLGVPVSFIIISIVLWITVLKPMRDTYIPRWLAAQEQQAKAMLDIAKIVESLQWEVRQSRAVSDANAARLAAMDVKFDQTIGRPTNSRTRGGNS